MSRTFGRGGERFALLQWWESAGADLAPVPSVALVEHALRVSLSDPCSLGAIRMFLAHDQFAGERLRDDEVVAHVLHGLERRRYALYRVREPALPALAPLAREEVEEKPVEQQERDWIEVRLADVEGNPIPAAAFRIELPDGSVRTANTDELGRARFPRIAPGKCRVTFTQLRPVEDATRFAAHRAG